VPPYTVGPRRRAAQSAEVRRRAPDSETGLQGPGVRAAWQSHVWELLAVVGVEAPCTLERAQRAEPATALSSDDANHMRRK
jgi:hypothetical protein